MRGLKSVCVVNRGVSEKKFCWPNDDVNKIVTYEKQ